MRKFDRNSVPLDDDSWGSTRNAKAQKVTSRGNVTLRGMDDELDRRQSGLKETSDARLEAECSDVIGKGGHTG